MPLRLTRQTCLCLACMGLLTLPAGAQGTRRPAPAATRTLDLQAERVESEFLKGLSDLAAKYEEAGETDKAAEMLKSILKVKPNLESVKNKLKEFDEAVFDENSVTVEVDSARSWVSAGVLVSKDKPFRVQAEGSYKFILNENLGPQGFQTQDPTRDLVSGVPAGGLMGMVAAAPQPSGGNRGRRDEGPKPFFLGKEREVSPDESGVLFLRLNVPPASKCIGKVKVTISGNFSKR